MSDYDHRDRSDSGYQGSGENYRHSDYRNRANMSSYYQDREIFRRDRSDEEARRGSWRADRDPDDRMNDRNIWTRSIDEVRSWFGDDEAERRRLRDEAQRMREEGAGRYSANERGWDSSRGYGSDIDRDYGRSDRRSAQTRLDRNRVEPGFFRSSNEYGGSRNRDFYRDYPTHNSGRSPQNIEDDEMKYRYEMRSDDNRSNSSNSPQQFGGRDYERNYPTRAERNEDTHQHDLSSGWQSNDSYRGYRSLNNTGRTGIGQDNRLGRDRDTNPNYTDQNYSHGDYTPNLNAGGQEYNSRHYEQRGRPGTAINEYAQRGYSEGYGRTGYSLNQLGNYSNSEMQSAKHPKNYRGADDRIYVEVCEALGRELDASNIEVTSSGSEITLSGSVRNRDEKRLAERIAERVHGVEDVHNRLTVMQESATGNQPAQGNSSRTDLAADGSSQADMAPSARTAANGSGKGSARR
jgi:hypothetical protein